MTRASGRHALSLTLLLACTDDGAPAALDTSTQDESTGESDGDGDGDPGDGEPGDGDGESGDGDGDGEPELPNPCAEPQPPPSFDPPAPAPCAPGALDHAPPPTLVDALATVPIDVLDLDASLVFHPRAEATCGEARVRFQVGPDTGMPILDFRQQPAELWLDGQPLELDRYVNHNFGRGNIAGFRVIEAELEACSIHELVVRYDAKKPSSYMPPDIHYAQDPARLEFDFEMSDLYSGRYLESWLPANMPWDQHPLHLALRIVDAEAPHVLISNAEIDELDIHDWQLEFPATTTSMSPMVVIVPDDTLSSVSGGVHMAANGQAIPWQLHVDADHHVYVDVVEGLLFEALDAFTLANGDYAHPAMIVYLWNHPKYSMEYAGATTSRSSLLQHEIHHSFWARGVLPANYADGWFDEAWTEYAADHIPDAVPLDPAAGPWQLFDSHPFARVTVLESYIEGRAVFRGIAAVWSVDELLAAMADLYQQSVFVSRSTAELELHLYCASGELEDIRAIFHRYVYGLDGEPEPLAVSPCG